MANTNNSYGTNRPGPDPIFTERIEVRLRKEQSDRLRRISRAFKMSHSDVIRLAIDQFTTSIEEGPFLDRLEQVGVGE